MTKGEPGEKTRGKHFSAGKHIFKTLLCPERENSVSCFWCGKSGKISSLHALTLKSREGQGISWGFCLINHWGFGKCILLLGLHWCLSKVTHLSKTRKSICSPAQKLLRWLVLFNCDFFSGYSACIQILSHVSAFPHCFQTSPKSPVPQRGCSSYRFCRHRPHSVLCTKLQPSQCELFSVCLSRSPQKELMMSP